MSSALPRRRTAPLVALALALGCGAAAETQRPAEVATAAEAPPPAARGPERRGCAAAICFRGRADAARAAGIDDVAADELGRAFALEPDEAGLRRWIDALARSGRHRAARAALAEVVAGPEGTRLRSVTAALERELAAAGPAGADRPPTLADPPSPALAEALAAHDRGDLLAARRAYATALAEGSIPPHLLVGVGVLEQRAGDLTAARRAWARARIELEERGATMELIAAETWFTSGLFWRGEQLHTVNLWTPIDALDPRRAESISTWTAAAGEAPHRELVLAGDASTTVATADGRLLLRGAGREVQLVDAERGGIVRSFTARGGEVREIISVGEGERLHVLVAAGGGAELWRGDGTHVADFALRGTTPTITRAYTGEGSYHHNILNDSPTWPVALALSADASVVAIGGSDSKVRLFDRRGGAERLLEYTWSYEERRPMGGNPDLNTPLAMAFVDRDAELMVVYAHGDVIRWRVKDGKMGRQTRGACGEAEATAMANRFRGPDDPLQKPTAEAREGCGRAQRAVIGPEGRWVLTATSFGGIRLRDLRGGKSRFLTTDYQVPHDLVAASPAGEVALGILYGHVVTWSEGEGLVPHHRGPEDTGPIDPVVSDSGRVLTFDLGRDFVRWDLLRGRDLAEGLDPGEVVIAAEDAATRVTRRGRELLLRRDGAPPRVLEVLGEDAEVSAQFAGTARDRLVVDLRGQAVAGEHQVIHHDLAAGARTVLPFAPIHGGSLSADGEVIGGSTGQGTIEVVRARDGRRMARVDAEAIAVALAPDASFIAWIERGKSPITVARVLPLADPEAPGAEAPAPIELRVPGWPKGLAIAPDSQEILVITQESITRWRGREGTATLLDERTFVSANRIHYSADGRHLFFENFHRVDVHRNVDGAPRVASIVPLLTGGFLVQGVDGAVDGSADAPLGVMTWVTGPGGEAMAARGELAWDRLAEPGLYGWILAQ
ncbi:MAG: hypothetical protein R3B09_04940 [Nannocystaceae bacterium]